MTLTKAELKILLTLENPITLSELAHKLDLSKSRLSTLLHSMSNKGLIEFEGKKPILIKSAKNKANELLNSIFPVTFRQLTLRDKDMLTFAFS